MDFPQKKKEEEEKKRKNPLALNVLQLIAEMLSAPTTNLSLLRCVFFSRLFFTLAFSAAKKKLKYVVLDVRFT